jgi:hypothetical protein
MTGFTGVKDTEFQFENIGTANVGKFEILKNASSGIGFPSLAFFLVGFRKVSRLKG